ncbi:MAG: hypothetical protein ACKV2V_20305 [Blastocatellia bacterium]
MPIKLMIPGEKYELPGCDVVVFRDDQKHSYANRGERTAIAYSAIIPGQGRIG